MKEYIHKYDSLTALYNTVHLKPSAPNKNHKAADQFRDDIKDYGKAGASWFGIATNKPSEVINAIMKGYKPGLDDIRTASALMEPFPIKSIKRKRSKGDQGDDLDIAKVYSGELSTAWTKTERVGGDLSFGKSITIAVDIGGNCNLSSAQMKWRGVYASVLADSYASAGYNVELYAYAYGLMVNDKRTNSLQTIVKILDTSEPFDLEKLANTICFPGFFRTLIFEDILTIPELADYGLGKDCEGKVPSALKEAIIVKGLYSLEDVRREQKKYMASIEL